VSAAGPADPDVAARIGRLAGAAVHAVHRLGGQHQWGHYRVVLADGRLAFAKVAAARLSAGLDGVFEAEARGLRWLADAGAVPVPDVLGWDASAIAVSWLPGEAPSPAAAERFGRDLAGLHLAGSASFGAPWPGFIASLPLGSGAGSREDSGGGAGDSWPQWYGRERLLPYARRALDAGTLHAPDMRLIELVASRAGALAGPAEPPSRIHGDCWSGNLLWSGGRGWLIDPAAHGGHRESDLAMLALFGAPYLDRIMAAYQEIAPLAVGWQARVPLHQLHPLLVHACLFGAAYRDAALGAARSALGGGG
jgi:fructosamine-3-kinase